MNYTDNPLTDFDNWDREQEKQLARLPRCSECGNSIYPDEFLFDFNGEVICEKCLNDNHRKWGDEFIK